MRLRSPKLAAALVAAALIPAATATAADREYTMAVGQTNTWTSDVHAGGPVFSQAAQRIPACSPVFGCDATLVLLTKQSDLLATIKGNEDTLVDVDLHVYASNAAGEQLDLYGASTGATAEETVLAQDLAPGYYLVYADWYLGVGTITGTVEAQPPTPLV